MYDQGRGIDIVEKPSWERLSLLSYVRTVLGGKEALDDSKLQKLIATDRKARQ
jgi:hypothetical protein